MTAKRKPKPVPVPVPVLVEIPAPPKDATPTQREVFRVERMLALNAFRLGIVVSGAGCVSSDDAARLIAPHRHDGDAKLRKWRSDRTGPTFTRKKNGRGISYSLHALAVFEVEQACEPNA